jgi:hypothetical protein
METLNVLDDLKAPNRNNDDLYSIIWDDLFCEFRDRGENIPEEELNKAVAIVISMVTFCLALLDSMKYNGVNGKLIRLLSNKYRGYRDFHRFTELRANIIGIDELKDWLAGYMQCDTYMYDEVMDYLEEKEEVEETNDEDSKIAPSKVRAQALLEILNLCNMGTDIQDVSKISRLIGFIIGHSPEKLRQTLIKDGRSIVLKRNTHQKHVDEVNKILSDMNSKIKLECE